MVLMVVGFEFYFVLKVSVDFSMLVVSFIVGEGEGIFNVLLYIVVVFVKL